MTAETNPLVAGVSETETVWTGSRLLEDGNDVFEAFNSKSWVAGGLAVSATTADTTAAVMDPLGEALSADVGWVIEHLASLNEWLEELTRDSDAVAAAATTWGNISTRLTECADWSARCFSDRGSFSSRESIGWRACQQRNTQRNC